MTRLFEREREQAELQELVDAALRGSGRCCWRSTTPGGIEETRNPTSRSATYCSDRDDLVFANSRGNTESRSNVTRRVLAPAITAANKKLEAAEEELIPEAGYVADQAGHTDAGFTYKRYRKAVKRHAGELEHWRALFHGEPMSPPDAAPAAHAAA